MSRFSDLLHMIQEKGLASSFQKVSAECVQRELQENPNIPKDYIDFLQEIGYGDIGNNGYFMFYSGLVPVNDIYSSNNIDELRDIVLIGDDFNGYCIGFKTNNEWPLVEVSESEDITYLNVSFERFVRDKILEYISDTTR